MTILERKFNKVLLLKLSLKNKYVKFDVLSRRNSSKGATLKQNINYNI